MDAASDAAHRITVLFDGECNVCESWVGLLERADRHGAFDFVAAQSPHGGRLLDQAGIPRDQLDTIVVIDNGHVRIRSDAILHAMTALGGGWGMIGAFRVVPRPARDLGYRAFARLRYRLFGKTRSCRISPPPA